MNSAGVFDSDEDDIGIGTSEIPRFQKWGKTALIRNERDWGLESESEDDEVADANVRWELTGKRNHPQDAFFTDIRSEWREASQKTDVISSNQSRNKPGPPIGASPFRNVKELSKMKSERAVSLSREKSQPYENDEYTRDGGEQKSDDGSSIGSSSGKSLEEEHSDVATNPNALVYSSESGENRRSGHYRESGQFSAPDELTASEMGLVENDHIPFIFMAHKSWARREHVRCILIRCKASFSNLYTETYQLVLESCNKTLMIARRRTFPNKNCSFYLFDMSRGVLGTTLTKKSCNYIGKLKGTNGRFSLMLVGESENQLAAMKFERQSVTSHLRRGARPRALFTIVPAVDPDSGQPMTLTHKSKLFKIGSNLLNAFDATEATFDNIYRYQTKQPVLQDGCYRLNFRGRVLQPSVKNFQLIPEDDIHNIGVLFGKVSEDRYHLDYKFPFTAIQAFACALAQFGLG